MTHINIRIATQGTKVRQYEATYSAALHRLAQAQQFLTICETPQAVADATDDVVRAALALREAALDVRYQRFVLSELEAVRDDIEEARASKAK